MLTQALKSYSHLACIMSRLCYEYQPQAKHRLYTIKVCLTFMAAHSCNSSCVETKRLLFSLALALSGASTSADLVNDAVCDARARCTRRRNRVRCRRCVRRPVATRDATRPPAAIPSAGSRSSTSSGASAGATMPRRAASVRSCSRKSESERCRADSTSPSGAFSATSAAARRTLVRGWAGEAPAGPRAGRADENEQVVKTRNVIYWLTILSTTSASPVNVAVRVGVRYEVFHEPLKNVLATSSSNRPRDPDIFQGFFARLKINQSLFLYARRAAVHV